MKFYANLSRLVTLALTKDTFDLALRANQATTYTANRTFDLPPGDSSQVLSSATSTQTFTNKTISGATNTITNVSLTTGVTGVLPVANGGTNSSAALNNNRVLQSSGGAIVEAAAITAARALISDANGIPTHSVTTATELSYVNGVTSAIQTQFTGKANQALNNLTVASLAAGSLLVGSNSTTVVNLAVGTNGQVLKVVSGSPAWAADSTVSSFKATWANADGATKSITHSLGTTDVMVQIFDVTTGETIGIDTEVRTDANTLDLTATEAPATNWRVLILAIP